LEGKGWKKKRMLVVMNRIGVETLPMTERKADFFWVLYERNFHKGIKSEDKLDGVISDNKRTKETT
jgi:hypothetical protein